MTDDSKGRQVNLVLGSGGARGLAHIGVIEELEKRGYRFRAIAGTSMGALVGGIYAMGKLDAYRDWVCSLNRQDILKLLDLNFSGGGFIRGKTLIDKLSEVVGDCDIEDLPFDYTAVAVDLDRGKEVWLDSGRLFDAIRASIAIPGIFTPHQYKQMTLVDGGLLNPVPIAPTLRTQAEFVIAVDANGEKGSFMEPGSANDGAAHRSLADRDGGLLQRLQAWLPGQRRQQALDLSDIMLRSLDLMQAQITRGNMALFKPELLVSIPSDICMIHQFERAEEIIAKGRSLAEAALDKFEKGVRTGPDSAPQNAD